MSPIVLSPSHSPSTTNPTSLPRSKESTHLSRQWRLLLIYLNAAIYAAMFRSSFRTWVRAFGVSCSTTNQRRNTFATTPASQKRFALPCLPLPAAKEEIPCQCLSRSSQDAIPQCPSRMPVRSSGTCLGERCVISFRNGHYQILSVLLHHMLLN
ncbi:hypothetical protein VTJ04DRAFT_933 [Mycothermus thermophilus]|uniref:uncharacterized protein n=1 Tax=Humicola insolens TaxID=85995 RepID=UPI003742141F